MNHSNFQVVSMVTTRTGVSGSSHTNVTSIHSPVVQPVRKSGSIMEIVRI